MIRPIKMVVLDMAGTTVNEDNVVYKTLKNAITESGISVTLNTVLEWGAGKEKHQAIKDIVSYVKPDETIDTAQIFKVFKKQLTQAYQTLEVTPVEGTLEVMQYCREKGIKVVLNTGYNREVATGLIKKLGWTIGIHYDLLLTADDVVKGRPHPDMIIVAMKYFDITNPEYVLKAGDSAIDIEEGQNANCGITVGVLSGAQDEQQLEKVSPTFIFNSISCLKSII